MEKDSSTLLDFIKASPSPFHVIARASEELRAAGFQELSLSSDFHLKRGGKYFLRAYGSAFVAFTVGEAGPLRMAVAHTDSPCFRLKPSASMEKEGYGVLNVEPYGGLMLRTWLDRPLSLAGKVVLRRDDPFQPEVRLFDGGRPLITIPSLAIHMDREVNEKGALKVQENLLPLATLLGETEGEVRKDFFLSWLAEEIGAGEEDILSYDLLTYPVEEGTSLGLQGELLSSPRLDNLTSVVACLSGLCAAEGAKGIRLIACFDNEEIGSRTKQGAAGNLLGGILARIYKALGTSEALEPALASGFLLSVDVAHATHPNYIGKMDPKLHPILGRGIAIKQAANQSYAGDAESVAIVRALAEEAGIPWQHFVNHSDARGGSTIGSMLSATLAIRAADIGVPILAMHSARETMARSDQESLERLLQRFLA